METAIEDQLITREEPIKPPRPGMPIETALKAGASGSSDNSNKQCYPAGSSC